MFISKGEEVGNPDPEHTMSKIQKAVGEDGMSRRQSMEHSIQKEELMQKINKMEDWGKQAVVR